MKKTLSINLGGRPFVIDEDAYNTLNDYLRQIERRQRTEEMADIERRLADRLAETGAAIIDGQGLQHIMANFGTPDQFGPLKQEPETMAENRPKRLYRSRTNRVIGGVCGGLAEYFGIDPLAVRLIYLILLFFGGSGFFLYVIFWIAIPEHPRTFMGNPIGRKE